MTSIRRLLVTSLILLLMVPAWAEEEELGGYDQIQRRTLGEIRDFLKLHLPDSLDHLSHLEEHDDAAAVDDFWTEAGTFVGEYYHTRELLGEEAAAAFLKVRRMEYMADVLTEQFHHSSDEAGREAIKEKLREVLGSHLTESLQLEKAHIDHARQKLDQATREMEQTIAERDRIIDDELKQRLYSRDESSDEVHSAQHPEAEDAHPEDDAEHPHDDEGTAADDPDDAPRDPSTSDSDPLAPAPPKPSR